MRMNEDVFEIGATPTAAGGVDCALVRDHASAVCRVAEMLVVG